MRIRVRVSARSQFGAVARRLQSNVGVLQADLTREVQGAAPSVLTRVKSTVVGAEFPAVPPRGGAAPAQFRARLAAAAKVLPRVSGVRFTVDGSVVGARGHRLAMLSDSELAPRWRHPVFGNRTRWVTQRGQPWFFAPIRAGEPRFAEAVERGMDRTARRILR